MAFVLQLGQGALTAVNAVPTSFLMQDNTGPYDLATNAGGYGTPNPARAYFALYLYGYRYVSGGPDSPITLTNTVPVTVTNWTVGLSPNDDGYRYFTMLAIPVFGITTGGVSGSVNYTIGNLVYLSSNNSYYICSHADTQAGGPLVNPSFWSIITDPTTIVAGLTSGLINGVVTSLVLSGIYYVVSNVVTTYFNTQQLQIQMSKEAQCNCQDVNFKDSNTSNRSEVRPYMRIFVDLFVANTYTAQTSYTLADDVLANLTNYTTTLNCSVTGTC